MRLRWIGVALVAVGLGLIDGRARADWPMPRHDPQRTGTAEGTSDIDSPAPYWRYYLGGAMSTTGAMLVDTASGPAVVYLSGGRLYAADLGGAERWRSEQLALIGIVARADLDGNGSDEIVAQSTKQAFVFDLVNGALRWAEREDDMGTIGGVRVADLDGDDLADVLVQECGCCQVRNGETGFAYSFAGGFDAPALLWELPYIACGGPRAMLIDDLDGDGDADVTLTDDGTIAILDGATGVEVASTADLGDWVSLSWCQAADVDGGGGKELVCALGTNLASPGTGHRVFVLRYAAAPSPALELVWQTDVGALDGTVSFGAGAVADLDGDGTLEIAAGGSDADGNPTVVVLDAADGAILGTIVDEGLVGTAPIVDGPGRLLMSQSDRRLAAWQFSRTLTGAPALTYLWELKERRALLGRDWAVAARSPLPAIITVADVTGDGTAELFAADTRRRTDTAAFLGADGTEALGSSFSLRPGAEPQLVLGPAGIDQDRYVVAGSDGVLLPLDGDLDPISDGVRFGGYHDKAGWGQLATAPVMATLDGAPRVLITDSRATLLALDPSRASNLVPPELQWEKPYTIAPAVIDGLDGAEAGVACRQTDFSVVPFEIYLSVLDAHGGVRWSHLFEGAPLADTVPANLDGDLVPDLVIQRGLPDDTALRIDGIAGADGTLLWTQAIDAGPTRLPSGAAIADWDGDGIDDVIVQHYGLRVLSGVDGAELAAGGPAVPYFMPTVADWDGDGTLDVTLHGGFAGSRGLEHDLTTAVWTSSEEDRPYPYGAAVTCAGESVFAGGSQLHPSRLKTTVQSGPQRGTEASVILAGGDVYASEAAADAAGARGGQLTSIYGHADLTGAGRPTVLVGSQDGWLYGVDPCTMTLDFALAFDAPVGGIAFGDGDGDGNDEIVVSVADGYLYGLRDAPIAAPGYVLDTQPEQGILDDIDVREASTRLSATWASVNGAAGYEVAVAREGGGYVTSPTWTPVGLVTSYDLDDLPLADGSRYHVAVRALAANGGASPDAVSDGVTIYLPAGPDAGVDELPETGCGCRSTVPSGAVWPLGIAVLFLAARRRRSPAGDKPPPYTQS